MMMMMMMMMSTIQHTITSDLATFTATAIRYKFNNLFKSQTKVHLYNENVGNYRAYSQYDGHPIRCSFDSGNSTYESFRIL